MSIINEKSEVYQNCSKCGKSSNETFRCIKCQKVFCKNEVGDKVRIGGGYVIKVERCKDCQKEEPKRTEIMPSEIKGFKGIKEEIKEKQKPIILMDEFERKPKETKPCLNPCPVHCKNK